MGCWPTWHSGQNCGSAGLATNFCLNGPGAVRYHKSCGGLVVSIACLGMLRGHGVRNMLLQFTSQMSSWRCSLLLRCYRWLQNKSARIGERLTGGWRWWVGEGLRVERGGREKGLYFIHCTKNVLTRALWLVLCSRGLFDSSGHPFSIEWPRIRAQGSTMACRGSPEKVVDRGGEKQGISSHASSLLLSMVENKTTPRIGPRQREGPELYLLHFSCFTKTGEALSNQILLYYTFRPRSEPRISKGIIQVFFPMDSFPFVALGTKESASSIPQERFASYVRFRAYFTGI